MATRTIELRNDIPNPNRDARKKCWIYHASFRAGTRFSVEVIDRTEEARDRLRQAIGNNPTLKSQDPSAILAEVREIEHRVSLPGDVGYVSVTESDRGLRPDRFNKASELACVIIEESDEVASNPKEVLCDILQGADAEPVLRVLLANGVLNPTQIRTATEIAYKGT